MKMADASRVPATHADGLGGLLRSGAATRCTYLFAGLSAVCILGLLFLYATADHVWIESFAGQLWIMALIVLTGGAFAFPWAGIASAVRVLKSKYGAIGIIVNSAAEAVTLGLFGLIAEHRSTVAWTALGFSVPGVLIGLWFSRKS